MKGSGEKQISPETTGGDLRQHVADNSVIGLVEKFLQAEVMDGLDHWTALITGRLRIPWLSLHQAPPVPATEESVKVQGNDPEGGEVQINELSLPLFFFRSWRDGMRWAILFRSRRDGTCPHVLALVRMIGYVSARCARASGIYDSAALTTCSLSSS